MKGYKGFILVFSLLLVIYIIAEATRPKPLNWTVTLSAQDKNPYGAYCLFHALDGVFPGVPVHSFRSPVYNQVNNKRTAGSAYLLLSPGLDAMSKEDVSELLSFTAAGNHVLLSSNDFSRQLEDTLHFSTDRRLDLATKDSVTINFKDPQLRTRQNIGFKRMTLDGYFKRYDTLATTVLGTNQLNDVNFIRMPFGKGMFYIHLVPLCFSNDFMLTRNNAGYTAKVLSHIPGSVNYIYWDEYYKPGERGSGNPLRYILNNEYLRWSFRIGLVTMLLYVLVGIKRRQRMIPVQSPLQNTTLDFVKTVGNVYFNRKDNRNIAEKMIGYLLEHIRTNFFLATNVLDEAFSEALSRKTGVEKPEVDELLTMISVVQASDSVSDQLLLQLNRQIDLFYKASD